MTDQDKARQRLAENDLRPIVVRTHGSNLAALLGAILAVVLIAAGVGGYALSQVSKQAAENARQGAKLERVVDRANRDRRDRQRQSCARATREFEANRTALASERGRLKDTLEFLRNADDPTQDIVVAVRRALPRTRADVAALRGQTRASKPPEFCRRALPDR